MPPWFTNTKHTLRQTHWPILLAENQTSSSCLHEHFVFMTWKEKNLSFSSTVWNSRINFHFTLWELQRYMHYFQSNLLGHFHLYVYHLLHWIGLFANISSNNKLCNTSKEIEIFFENTYIFVEMACRQSFFVNTIWRMSGVRLLLHTEAIIPPPPPLLLSLLLLLPPR